MSRVARLFAILLAFFVMAQAAPRATDITAIYAAPDGRETRRIEAAANGDVRIGLGSDAYLLWHDGQGYMVSAGPGGPVVHRLADIAAGSGAPRPVGPDRNVTLVAGAAETVNGRTGTAYSASPPPSPGAKPVLVISDDPALAPIGKALMRYIEMMSAMAAGEERSGMTAALASFARGAPLRMGPDVLKSVDTTPIPAERFALPAAPLPSAMVRGGRTAGADIDADAAALNRTTFKRAVFAGGMLWLLSDSGALTMVDPGRKRAEVQAMAEPVVDLCRRGDALVAVTAAPKATRWTLRQRSGSGWTVLGSIDGAGDTLVATTCAAGRVTVLTDRRLIDQKAAGQDVVRLSEPLGRPSVIVTLYDDGAALFVGYNIGEWGGGLRRIDRATGRVRLIENKGAKKYCGRPLDSGCDPVNGIAAMPGRPDCVVAAVGLVHMASHGRLVRVCGDEVMAIFYKPYTIEKWSGYDPAVPEPFETVAFFGLARADAALWAVGVDGLYRIDEAGGTTFRALPEFETIDGISVSFALPGLVLVRTTINQRASLSGAVPMVVER